MVMMVILKKNGICKIMIIILILLFSPVTTIRPSDIECFGAIGDSITAGFSMESHSLMKDFFEYRGESFSIGAKKGFRTIPNIFSNFYPDLNLHHSCASYSTTFISRSFNDYHKPVDCNVAISGAQSYKLEKMWVAILREWSNYNCTNRYKLLTVMIGANDICAYCINGYNTTIKNYLENMENLLKNILRQSGRIFVNIISVFDVSLTMDWQTPSCKFVHWVINECPCILGRYKQNDASIKVKMLYKDINARLYPLVENYGNRRDDVVMVVQPILEEFKIYNSSYLSSLDCFHPSKFADNVMSTILWNNMFLPKDKKLKNMKIIKPLHIPKWNESLS